MATYEKIESELNKAREDYRKAEKELREFMEEENVKKFKELWGMEKLKETKKRQEKSKERLEKHVIMLQELASERIIEFWKAALSLMINPDDKFTSFPDDVNIFGSEDFGSNFIIRECYMDLWKLITEDKKYNGWIVTGNPGIGKSMFGLFLLIHLTKQGKTVKYEHFLKKHQHKFQPNGCIFKGEFEKELLDDKTWYIMDTTVPKTLDVNAKRYVFDPEKWTEDQLLLEINQLSSEIHANIVNDGKFSCETRHKIYHIYTKPPKYNDIYMEFVSPYACKKVAELYEQQHKSELLAFLKASDYGVWGSVHGNLFENYAHRVISRRVTFNVHELGQSATESKEINVEFPKYKLKEYKDISEIENNSYCIPHSKTNEGFDSLVPPNKFFQMTVSHAHPIN
ncbi:15074_t:CDS:2 [Entrophospora sp. SA101]|nr:18690_t:CDS:2 [Entrophospora sp. SA101]CAJ0768925.1 15074_t:CDS:2 [Entrophospora sp. SA101]